MGGRQYDSRNRCLKTLTYNPPVRENELLQYVYAANGGLSAEFPGVTIPPGDDMGGIDFGGSSLLVAVDQVVSGVHFELGDTPVEKVGRKAVTRNLSDIAAMGVKPVAAVVAVCLPRNSPRNFGQDRATALFDAMRTTAAAFACPLIGGDIAMWDGQLVISVTVLAEPWRDEQGEPITPVKRGGSQPGDVIYVTGQLGYSFPTGHHLDFTPRIELARRLVADPSTRPRAMIDLSDGIAQDLPRLVDHAALQADNFPLRPHTAADDTPAWQHALGDGEDYELLFTAAADAPIPSEIDEVLITRIGTVTAAHGITVQTPDGRELPLESLANGWEHRG